MRMCDTPPAAWEAGLTGKPTRAGFASLSQCI